MRSSFRQVRRIALFCLKLTLSCDSAYFVSRWSVVAQQTNKPSKRRKEFGADNP
jgi:hypothetical protein